MMFSRVVLIFLLLGGSVVIGTPIHREAREMKKRSSFNEDQVLDCLSEGLRLASSPSSEISQSCQFVLQQALFPHGPPASSTETQAPWQGEGAAAISSEEGVYWLWGLLNEDCEALQDLLADLAVHIAKKLTTKLGSAEVPGEETGDEPMRKRDETTTFSGEAKVLELYSQMMTREELARLMANRPNSTDLIGSHSG